MSTAYGMILDIINYQVYLSQFNKNELLNIINKENYSTNRTLRYASSSELIRIILTAKYSDEAIAIDKKYKELNDENIVLTRAIKESIEESRTPLR